MSVLLELNNVIPLADRTLTITQSGPNQPTGVLLSLDHDYRAYNGTDQILGYYLGLLGAAETTRDLIMRGLAIYQTSDDLLQRLERNNKLSKWN